MKQKYRAESDRERSIVLASLPEVGLLSTIEAHAKEGQNGDVEALRWLGTIVNGGFLEMSDCLRWDSTVFGGRGMNTRENEPFIYARAERFDALMAFVKGIELVGGQHKDPIYGELERSSMRAKLSIDPDFTKIFAQACDRLVSDDEAFFEVSNPSQQSQSRGIVEYRGLAFTHWLSREETFAKALAAACMLGLPEQVTAMGLRCPEAMSFSIDQKAFLGDVLVDRLDKTELCVTPYYCAFQLSRNECIDALVAAGMPGDCHLVALKYANDKLEHTKYGVEEFIGRNLLPFCAPSTLEKAIRLADAVGKDASIDMHQIMVDALDGKKMCELDAHLPAFLETGRFDVRKDPEAIVRLACTHGYPSLVKAMEHAGTIPWGRIGFQHVGFGQDVQTQAPDSDIFSLAASRVTTAGEWVQGKIEGSLLALFDAAERAGPDKVAGLMTHYSSESLMPGEQEASVSFEPINSVILAPFEKVMVRMMQNGLDPSVPFETTTNRSPIEFAEAIGKGGIAHTMRTFVSHQRASRALRELDDMLNEPETPRP